MRKGMKYYSEKRLTKDDLATEIAKKIGIDKILAYSTLDALISVMDDKISNGYTVTLRGLGTFTSVLRKGKSGWDFKNKVTFPIKAAYKFKFLPAERIEEKLKKLVADER